MRAPALRGDAAQAQQLGLGFDVEAEDRRVQRLPDLGRALADAGEHHLGRIAAGAQHPRQLAAGDDVEAGTQARQHLQHRQVGVGLHRIADAVVQAVQRLVEGAIVAAQGGAGIDVGGRAVLRGDGGQRHILGAELAVAVVEVIHLRLRGRRGFGGGRGRR
jgi:hypothetical protein